MLKILFFDTKPGIETQFIAFETSHFLFYEFGNNATWKALCLSILTHTTVNTNLLQICLRYLLDSCTPHSPHAEMSDFATILPFYWLLQILQFYRLLQMDPPPLRLLNPFPEIEDLSLQQLTFSRKIGF